MPDPNAIATPPPLSLPSGVDSASTATPAIADTSDLPYQFLYREDPEIGIVRDQLGKKKANEVRNTEYNRLISTYQQRGPNAGGARPPGNPGQGAQAVSNDRLVAEWDMYYEQLQFYSDYVRTKIVPRNTELYKPTFESAKAQQEHVEMLQEFQRAASDEDNRLREENLAVYDRIAEREDRQRDYQLWIADQTDELRLWSKAQERKSNGAHWNNGEEVNVDDWYAGTNYRAPGPKDLTIEGNRYVVGLAPEQELEADQLSIVTANLSPYDLVDPFGVLKNAQIERLRAVVVKQEAFAAGAEVATTNTIISENPAAATGAFQTGAATTVVIGEGDSTAQTRAAIPAGPGDGVGAPLPPLAPLEASSPAVPPTALPTPISTGSGVSLPPVALPSI